MQFEENWPWGFSGEIVQTCGRIDDGRQVVTIAHAELCSGELNIHPLCSFDIIILAKSTFYGPCL